MFRRQALIVGMLAAASLLFESTLTRLLAVTQFYHFAFLVVSLALLGYGTSGTILSIFPNINKIPLDQILSFGTVGFVLSVAIAYAVVNYLPFDSYSIAWDQRQILFFFLYYLALTLPFTMSGLVTGAAISQSVGRSHVIYAANLLGSGLGALLAPFTLWLSGVPGSVLFSGVIGMVAIFLMIPSHRVNRKSKFLFRLLTFFITVFGLIIFVILIGLNLSSRSPLGLILSPYKGLSQANRYPGVESVFSRWNAISRVDILRNSSTHHLPGLSYEYEGSIPQQLGISLDADSLQPISLTAPAEFDAADYLPEALVFKLKPNAETLVIKPGGGLGILQALTGGSTSITVVMDNPLVKLAVQQSSGNFNVFNISKVDTVLEPSRVFLERSKKQFDVLMIPLTDGYRPVSSGAYSLAEDFLFTVEAFNEALIQLSSDGILVITRWIQYPPSESLRVVTTLIETLDDLEIGDPGNKMVMYRGIQTITILVKPSGWNFAELRMVRDFIQKRKFDLVWAPDLKTNEINIFNRLPDPIFYDHVQEILSTSDRKTYYDSYPFDINPPSDNKPFFFHFFKWEQTSEVLTTIGHVWQPFGGSGYLVTIALLILVVILSFFLILMPLFFQRKIHTLRLNSALRWKSFLYYTFIGIGFMFVEIPLIQRSILYLGYPIVAFTVVVFSILVFSSLGSRLTKGLGRRSTHFITVLMVLTLIIPLIHDRTIDVTLGWMFSLRVLLTMLILAPLAFFMGIPFPLGIIELEKKSPEIITWVWAVNGTTSVIASVLAAILALTFGFTTVQYLGVMMYVGAVLVYQFGLRFSHY